MLFINRLEVQHPHIQIKNVDRQPDAYLHHIKHSLKRSNRYQSSPHKYSMNEP